MATLEQVEKLRERANVTFEEARAALDASDGDLLDAMIFLERQGKVAPPSGGEYSGSETQREIREAKREWDRARNDFKNTEHYKRNKEGREQAKTVFKNIGNFILRLIQLGNANFFDAMRDGKVVLSCPVTVLVILLIFFFWVVTPLIVLGLFFGWRYRFRGENKNDGRDNVNTIIEKAEAIAHEFKSSFTEKMRDDDDSADEAEAETEDE